MGEMAVQGGGEERGILLCGRDQFTRRNVDACAHCENSTNAWPGKRQAFLGHQKGVAWVT